MEQLGGIHLLPRRRVDGVALDDAGVVLAGVVDGGLGEGPRHALAAMRTGNHEAGDGPDAGILEIGMLGAAGDDAAVRESLEVRARLNGAPPDGRLTIVGKEAGPRVGGRQLCCEQVAKHVVIEGTELAPGDLVPLAPAVRRVAPGAEDRLDVGERRLAGRNHAQRTRCGLAGHLAVHDSTVSRGRTSAGRMNDREIVKQGNNVVP